MRRGLLLSVALLASAASCERRLEGLPCEGNAEHTTEDGCLRGYTCCDGLCVSAPSSECLAGNAGAGATPGAGRGGASARAGEAGREFGGVGGRPRGGAAGLDGGAKSTNAGAAPVGATSGLAGALPVAGSGAFGGDERGGAGGETSSGGHDGSDAAGAGSSSGGASSGASGQSAAGSSSSGSPGSSGSDGRGGAQKFVRITHDYPMHHFGGPGGSLFADVCPADQVLIGVEGHVGDGYLKTLAALCGVVRIDAPDGAGSGTAMLRIDEGAVLPKRGVLGGTNQVSRCPVDHVVIGLDMAHETTADGLVYVKRLRLQCGVLSLDPAAEMPTIQTLPDAEPLDPLLEWPEGPPPGEPITCGTGISRGLLVRSGQWVDGFAFACGEPLVALTNGSPCRRDEECASGVCGECGADCRSCQPFECSPPANCRCSFFDSKYYLFCSGRRDHTEAGSACSEAGGHLVYVDSKIENGWARSTASHSGALAGEFWLGATDSLVEGQFQWTNGLLPEASLDFWPPEPRVGEELDCLQLNSDGQWQSGSCGEPRPYVCELE